MATKKYQLKSEVEKFADGSNNDENIKDMLESMEMLFDNIQENNDICIAVFKEKQKQMDEDVVDALQIVCQDMLEVEKEADEVMAVVKSAQENLSKLGKKSQADLEILLTKLQNIEKKSKKFLERIFSA